ncbi:hypothetical protein TGRUB_290310 [Toxoplasma gondii RUB]|uniref:Uncharacterized protein n=1 Tax=Toxoplasma gondii RUB TaxID=935652 RepID=A0A086M1K1_TOXGO|nr:hypothetical protein TGRUB_290310 [Toxoplasma gondii RUB]
MAAVAASVRLRSASLAEGVTSAAPSEENSLPAVAPRETRDLLAVLLMSPSPISVVEGLFASGADGTAADAATVSNVQKVLTTLTLQQASRAEELRNLIGLRYLSFLHSTASLQAMIEAASDLDRHASRVCAIFQDLCSREEDREGGEAEEQLSPERARLSPARRDRGDVHGGAPQDAASAGETCRRGGGSERRVHGETSPRSSRREEGEDGGTCSSRFSNAFQKREAEEGAVTDSFFLEATPLDSWIDEDGRPPRPSRSGLLPQQTTFDGDAWRRESRDSTCLSPASAPPTLASALGPRRQKGVEGRRTLDSGTRPQPLQRLLQGMQLQLVTTSRFWRFIREASFLRAFRLLCVDLPAQQRNLAETLDAIQRRVCSRQSHLHKTREGLSGMLESGERAGCWGTVSDLVGDCRAILNQAREDEALLLQMLYTYTLQSLAAPLLSSRTALQAFATLLLLPDNATDPSSPSSSVGVSASCDVEDKTITSVPGAFWLSVSRLSSLIEVLFSCRNEALYRLRAFPSVSGVSPEPLEGSDRPLQRVRLCPVCRREEGRQSGEETQSGGRASLRPASLSTRPAPDSSGSSNNVEDDCEDMGKHASGDIPEKPGSCLACTLHKVLFAFESSVATAGLLFFSCDSSRAADGPPSSSLEISSPSSFAVIASARAALCAPSEDGADSASPASLCERKETFSCMFPQKPPEVYVAEARLAAAEKELSALAQALSASSEAARGLSPECSALSASLARTPCGETPKPGDAFRDPASSGSLASLLLSRFARFWARWRKESLLSVACVLEDGRKRGALQTCRDVQAVWAAVLRRLDATRAPFLSAPCSPPRVKAAGSTVDLEDDSKQGGVSEIAQRRLMWGEQWKRYIQALLPSAASSFTPREASEETAAGACLRNSQSEEQGAAERNTRWDLVTAEAAELCRRLCEDLLSDQVERRLSWSPSDAATDLLSRPKGRRVSPHKETPSLRSSNGFGAAAGPLAETGVSEAAQARFAHWFRAFNAAFSDILNDAESISFPQGSSAVTEESGRSEEPLSSDCVDPTRHVLLRALLSRVDADLQTSILQALTSSSSSSSSSSSAFPLPSHPPSLASSVSSAFPFFLDASPLAPDRAAGWGEKGRSLELLLSPSESRTGGRGNGGEDEAEPLDHRAAPHFTARSSAFFPSTRLSLPSRGLPQLCFNSFANFLSRSLEERQPEDIEAEARSSVKENAARLRHLRKNAALAREVYTTMCAGSVAAFSLAALEILKPISAAFRQALGRAVLLEDAGLRTRSTGGVHTLGGAMRPSDIASESLLQEALRRRHPGGAGSHSKVERGESREAKKTEDPHASVDALASESCMLRCPREPSAATMQMVMRLNAEASKLLDCLGIHPLFSPSSCSSSSSIFLVVFKVVAGDVLADIVEDVLSAMSPDSLHSQHSASSPSCCAVSLSGVSQLLFDTYVMLSVFKPSPFPSVLLRLLELRQKARDAAKEGTHANEQPGDERENEGQEGAFVSFFRGSAPAQNREDAEKLETLEMKKSRAVWSSILRGAVERQERLAAAAQKVEEFCLAVETPRRKLPQTPGDTRADAAANDREGDGQEAVGRIDVEEIRRNSTAFLSACSLLCDPLFTPGMEVSTANEHTLLFDPPPLQLLPPRERFQLLPVFSAVVPGTATESEDGVAAVSRSLSLDQPPGVCAPAAGLLEPPRESSDDGLSFKTVSKNLQTWLGRSGAVVAGALDGGNRSFSPVSDSVDKTGQRNLTESGERSVSSATSLPSPSTSLRWASFSQSSASQTPKSPSRGTDACALPDSEARSKNKETDTLEGTNPAGLGAAVHVDAFARHMGHMGSFFGRHMEQVQNRVSEVVRKGIARIDEVGTDDKGRNRDAETERPAHL